MDLVVYVLLVMYALILGALFIFGLNFFYFSYLALKHRGPDRAAPPLTDYPQVTVQLPIYNEKYVARRLIDAVCQLDWPREKLEIQVLDDSTDSTVEIVTNAVQHYRLKGFYIEHLHRTDRSGYKAGALSNGLNHASGDLIAIFDADFVPQPDFLQQTIPHFEDENVGFVQTRWGHLNEDYSLLTKLQALSIDAHFMIEQFVRHREGLLMNFNGTAGVWRRKAIEEAGGWKADTLTEDLDLSYRAQLAGWKAQYLRDVITPAELLISPNAYRRQQYRWARGSLECAQRLIPQLLQARLTRRVKWHALLHLTGYGIHLLMFMLAVLYPFIAVLSVEHPFMVTLYGIALIFNFTAFAPTIFFMVAQHELNRQWWRQLPAIIFLTVLGSGMMVNNVLAILHAFMQREGVFERTPKFGIVGKSQSNASNAYKVHISPRVIMEVGMLLYNLNTIRLAVAANHIVIVIYAGLFATGLAFILGLTLWQSLQPHLAQFKMSIRRFVEQV